MSQEVRLIKNQANLQLLPRGVENIGPEAC